MAEKEDKDRWEKIVGWGLLGVGAYLLYKFLKAGPTGASEIFTCPNCGRILSAKHRRCPWCGILLKWPNPSEDGEEVRKHHLVGKAFWFCIVVFVVSLAAILACPWFPVYSKNRVVTGLLCFLCGGSFFGAGLYVLGASSAFIELVKSLRR